jgi:5-aminopentanamidase
VTTIRLALAQIPSVYHQKAANLERAERVMRLAADGGAQLILFPEMFLTGYLVWERLTELAEPLDGPSIRRLQQLALDLRLLTVCGFPERAEGDALYNTACVIDRDGRLLGGYRKTHLFADEPGVFSPGDRLPVFESALGTVGVLICYDIEFPEPVRAVALSGAPLILVSTANMEPYEVSQEVFLRSRALENGIYMAVANTIGEDHRYRYFGQSSVANPQGKLIARAGPDEGIVMADLDLNEASRAQQASAYLGRRRPSLYGTLTRSLYANTHIY